MYRQRERPTMKRTMVIAAKRDVARITGCDQT